MADQVRSIPSKTSAAFINSGLNLVVVAHSIFSFLVEFDNYINILSSLAFYHIN